MHSNLPPCRAILITSLFSSVASAQFLEPDAEVLHTITGSNGEFTGFVGNPAGDLNGDGASELLLGAPYFLGTRGRAHVYDGRTGTLLQTLAHFDNAYQDGCSVRSAGDISGDGVPDLLVGGIGPPFGAGSLINGRVTAWSGADFSILWITTGEAPDDAFGYSVAGLMDDYDGDGLNDVLATATRWDSTTLANAGRLYILSGADGFPLATFDGFGRAFGSSLVSIDDVNGDGQRDISIGARQDGTGSRGRVHIVRTTFPALTLHTSLDALATGVELGWYFMDSAGDVDGDGANDLYVSDFADNGGTGRGYVFAGDDFALLRNIPARRAGEGFGIGRFCGDVDGDGHDDLYLGAYTNSQGASAGGKGYVISGADASTLFTHTCTVSGCTAGYDAAGIGDVNGDGAPDFMITGTGDTPAHAAAANGVAYIIAGIPNCPADLSGSSDPNSPAYGAPDGIVDTSDFFYFLDQFALLNLSIADLTGSSDPNDAAYGIPDGTLDASDFFYFLDLFAAGCS